VGAATTRIAESLTQDVQHLEGLAERLDALVRTIERSDLLPRLDGITDAVSGLQTVTQQVSMRIEACERNVKDTLEARQGEQRVLLVQSVADAVARLEGKMQAAQAEMARRVETLQLVIIIVGVIMIGVQLFVR
jgi:hypothetical protein